MEIRPLLVAVIVLLAAGLAALTLCVGLVIGKLRDVDRRLEAVQVQVQCGKPARE
jgi:exosortase/archaeosortase